MKTKNTTGILGLRKKFIRKTIRELRTQFIIIFVVAIHRSVLKIVFTMITNMSTL